MTNVDQFESVFRSAAKDVFALEQVSIGSILVITDKLDPEAYEFGESIKGYLKSLDRSEPGPAWDVVMGSEFDQIDGLLNLVKERNPDLICTHRHLHSTQWQTPYTLGDYVEVLTQATSIPILVVPHPDAKRAAAHALRGTGTVMAMTDHLSGDSHLVNWAIQFTDTNGTLFLTHVEDVVQLERFIDAISKIPTIDTDNARVAIEAQLLKEPRDFIESCKTVVQDHSVSVHIQEIVTCGHHLSEYKRLVTEHEVNLLVMNTKDEDQLAMHGLAYPLAVELREIPLLML